VCEQDVRDRRDLKFWVLSSESFSPQTASAFLNLVSRSALVDGLVHGTQ